MARIRTVKPELFRHEELFEAELLSGLPLRLSFIALFTACDREGRFKWRPRQLKLDCLPYDEIDFSRVLDALVTRGFVVKYEVSGDFYGCIPSFSRHQSINNKESESVYPAPQQKQSVSSEEEPDGSENKGLCDEDLRVLDALITRDGKDQGEGEGEGREKEREGEREERVSDAPPPPEEPKPKTVDQILADLGIDGDLARDFKKHRKTKRAEITETAMAKFQREAEKAGISIQDAVRIATEKGWTTFEAGWNWKGSPGQTQPQQPKPPPQYIPKEQRKAAYGGETIDSTATRL